MNITPLSGDIEAIRLAKEHLLAQGKKCLLVPDEASCGCSYHRESDQAACGIGGIMPLEMRIEAQKTNFTIDDLLLEDEMFSAYFANCSLEVLQEIKDIHDSAPIEKWEALLDELTETVLATSP